MNETFNVLDKGWIPVRTNQGAIKKFGIRQVLSCAHELQEISIASPMEEYSVYRFLGIFLMDALRPETESDIEELIWAGKFDMSIIENYISDCQTEGVSFDLFDPKRPFLQSPYDKSIDKEKKPVGEIDFTFPHGNNHTHFDHRQPESLYLTPAKAARLLIAVQLFCTAGVQEYPSGVNGAPPYFGIVKGTNLFETLSYTLIPINSINLPFDNPPVIWRSYEPIQPKNKIAKTSWLKGMLFPARRIKLIKEKNSERITCVYICQGENYENKKIWHDPHVTYRTTKEGLVPLRPHSNRPIWQNLTNIIDIPGNHASDILKQYISVSDSDTASIKLYGVETNQASYLSVCQYDFVFPVNLTCDQNNIDLLRESISISEKLAKSLTKILSDITSLPTAIVSISLQRYYKQCEDKFWKLCNSVLEGKKENRVLYSEWCNDISECAEKIFREAVKTLQLRASTLAETVRMQDILFSTIIKIKKEANR